MTPTLTATAICPTPEPLIAAPDDGGDAAYFTLASKLGVRNAFIVRRELENAIRQENIHVYDRKAVDAWMASLVKKQNERLTEEWKVTASPEAIARFVEHESRPRTMESVLNFALSFSRFDGPTQITWGWRPLTKSGKKVPGRMEGIYAHAVPFAALATMEKILTHVPDAQFLISDYRAVDPDPFMMVTHKLLATDGLVVERWSEPGFRG